MFGRASWTSQEDDLLVAFMSKLVPQGRHQQNQWKQVAQFLWAELHTKKSARQCRDRWKNHLCPQKNGKTLKQALYLNQLFTLQGLYGNQWVTIASKLPEKTHLQAKNIFWSAMKKGIRLLNSFISTYRRDPDLKGIRPFSQSIICKIIAQDQGKSQKVTCSKDGAQDKARDIKKQLQKICQNQGDENIYRKLIEQLRAFNRCCQKIRKRKNIRTENGLSDQQQDQGSRSESQYQAREYFSEQIKQNKNLLGEESLEDNKFKIQKREKPNILERHNTESDLTKSQSLASKIPVCSQYPQQDRTCYLAQLGVKEMSFKRTHLLSEREHQDTLYSKGSREESFGNVPYEALLMMPSPLQLFRRKENYESNYQIYSCQSSQLSNDYNQMWSQ